MPSSKRHFLSICSGIEAASVAFQPLGWEAVAFAEIEPFPSAVLAHHYPQIPNLGDMRRFRQWDEERLARADMLCGGTPCQAFSVAGLRGSLDDERGNLTLTFCHLYDHLDTLRRRAGRPPAVCLWENVPGVLSTADNAFGSFLAGLAGESVPLQPPGGKWAHAGYVRGPARAVAWRVLDAQYFGLAQRRQRVFVVASADPAFDPAAVLFEFDGLRRDSPPSREAGQGTARGFETGPSGSQFTNLAPTLDTRCKDGPIRNQLGLGVAELAVSGERETIAIQPLANCLTRRMSKGLNTTLDEGQTPVVEVTHALRAEGFDASEDGPGRGTPIVPVAFDTTQITSAANRSQPQPGDPCHPLAAQAHPPAIAFTSKDHGADAAVDLAPTLRASGHTGSHANGGAPPAIAFPERLSGTACASTADLSPALGAVNPTAVAFDDAFAFDLRGRDGGAMPEGPHPTANLRASSGGSSRSYVAAPTVQEAVGFSARMRGDDGRGYDRPPQVFDEVFGTVDTMKPHHVAYAIQERAVCENPNAGPDGVGVRADDCAYTLEARQVPQAVAQPVVSNWRVRRLTCEECEILQGFPIGYTLIPGKHRPRKAADHRDTMDYLLALGFGIEDAAMLAHGPDGPRYKALGNSWAVPCARWIGARITAALDALHPCAKPLSCE